MKKVIGVIPARYQSTRLSGKPLADISGRPMLWWVYNRAKEVESLDDLIVAIDDKKVADVCEKYEMKYVMTSKEHDTPTSRIYEVSTKVDGDYYVFISGDEPLIDVSAIEAVVTEARRTNAPVVNAMTKIKTAPEVIDTTNIKVVINTKGSLLYATRSPLPFPKGRLDYDYMKFVGIGAFSKDCLKLYHDTPREKLEQIEECDLLRFIEQGVQVRMVEVDCQSISIDTPKDLEKARAILGGGVQCKSSVRLQVKYVKRISCLGIMYTFYERRCA